jgi:hypothetical protein
VSHKDPVKRLEYVRKWKKRVGLDVLREKHRNWRIPKLYGITVQEYDDLLEGQDFKCALCKRDKSFNRRGYALAIDHDHDTGKIRGLLCSVCNRLLSKSRGLDFFERAVEYLTTSPVGKSGKTIRVRKPDVVEVDKLGKIVYN